nr:hypothetical protein [Tanacetum cinerariifolium]
MMINLATPSSEPLRVVQRAWFELGRGSLAKANLLQRYEALSDDYGELYEAHSSCKECADKEVALAEKLAVVEKETGDLLDKTKDQAEHIKRLEDALAFKTSSLSEADKIATQLKGDLECLTIDLSQAEVVRHNYMSQCLAYFIPLVFPTTDESKCQRPRDETYSPKCKSYGMSPSANDRKTKHMPDDQRPSDETNAKRCKSYEVKPMKES